uniref:GOLD domain-containing protein n=1 Tax=Aegilops tauschii subsp. strangulata TaxID=200361 RepID=A0A453PPP3_AEGTS
MNAELRNLLDLHSPLLQFCKCLCFLQVTSPYGYTLHENGNVTVGQFAFTTSEAGNFLACFWIDSAEKGSGVSVNLDWKTGIATKDWDAIAKKEKIE